MIRLADKQPPQKPTADPLRDAGMAIDRLASMVQQTSQAVSTLAEQASRQQPQVLPPEQPRPVRYEASIFRDKAGKMTSVVIEPIYD